MSYVVEHGVCVAMNEGDPHGGIVGVARTMREFCENVTVLVDPTTTDNTARLLEEKCGWANVEYQDRSLGDSDEMREGPTCSLVMHANKTKWVTENVKNGEWFLWIDADERFAPRQYDTIRAEIHHAAAHGYDKLVHNIMIEPVSVGHDQLEMVNYPNGSRVWMVNLKVAPVSVDLPDNFAIDWSVVRLSHVRFSKKSEGWANVGTPHGGFNNVGVYPLFSVAPLYHFHRLKNRSILPTSWRDARGSLSTVIDKFDGRVPVFPFYNPFTDWRNMDGCDILPEYYNERLNTFNVAMRAKYLARKLNKTGKEQYTTECDAIDEQ